MNQLERLLVVEREVREVGASDVARLVTRDDHALLVVRRALQDLRKPLQLGGGKLSVVRNEPLVESLHTFEPVAPSDHVVGVVLLQDAQRLCSFGGVLIVDGINSRQQTSGSRHRLRVPKFLALGPLKTAYSSYIPSAYFNFLNHQMLW